MDAVLARPQPALAPLRLIEPSPDILWLLDEVDRDPTGIFWG